MSVYDDGTDLGERPPLPATETRGGEDIDWDAAEPGQPLPERKPQGEGNEEMTEAGPDWFDVHDPETGKLRANPGWTNGERA